MATPAEGPSFGIAPDGTWMWMSCLRKKSGSMPYRSAFARTQESAARIDSCITSPRCPVIVNCFPPRMLRGFDEYDVAARGSPDQSDRSSRPLHSLFHFLFDADLREAQSFPDHFRRDHQLVGFSFGHAPRLLADQCGDLAFQVPHARFPRVAVNDFVQRSSVNSICSPSLIPCSAAWRGIRYRLAMWIFSSSV